jgi:hypothetical protein
VTWAALRFRWPPDQTRRQRIGDLFAVLDGDELLVRETSA